MVILGPEVYEARCAAYCGGAGPGPWPPATLVSGNSIGTRVCFREETGTPPPSTSGLLGLLPLEGTARLPPAQAHQAPSLGQGSCPRSAQLGLRHCSVPQVVLIVSGNLSFLNWLTIVPSIACFDDATMGFLFPSGPGSLKDQVLKMQKEEAREARPTPTYGCIGAAGGQPGPGRPGRLAQHPCGLELAEPKQVMNSSFNPLRIVNTYGAFGSITRERTEVILQGTASPNASAPDTVWEDYEFKCKPVT
ncbi:hypothetical protein QTO34_013354 [Cnephaeus nilssonii]|uniref:Lipase maturation factor n=1 Tax=Cnephaeus nilssonii TaxID=3371016 RepID=A0AA40LSL9_CNENI|nr:hypothetical protein QTO34_013354 [Eptesicus nilssonii]